MLVSPLASEESLHPFLDGAVEGIVTIDEDGVIQSFNHAAERIFGYDSDDVVGKKVNVLMPAPHRKEHGRYIMNYLRSESAKAVGLGREVTGRRRDGTVFPMYLALSETKIGSRLYFTGMIRDVTERTLREKELRLAKAVSEAAERAKSKLLAQFSRNMRTPLTSIIGFAELRRASGAPAGHPAERRAAEIRRIYSGWWATAPRDG